MLELPAPLARPPAEPIGTHRLRGGKVALGVAFPFGHSDAGTLERLADAAESAGAAGIRTAPGRALLLIGVDPDEGEALGAVCERLGCITRADDPRRHVAACAGAPTCAAAEMPARTVAEAVAAAAAPLLDGSLDLHLSGCPKGCAHRGAAALTIVGSAERYGLVLDGDARGTACAHVAAPLLPATLARLARAVESARRPRERAADTLARLGATRVAAVLGEAVDA
jgi:precorrin-3B synthase